MKILNKVGLWLSPCFTPISDLKQLLKLLSIFTLRTLHEYIDLIILKNLPLIPFFRSLYNNAEWMTESNAFLRSTKQAYIFPDFCMYLQINVFNLKIWSAVLDPFLKPICSLLSILFSFKNITSLLLRILLQQFTPTTINSYTPIIIWIWWRPTFKDSY